MKILLLIGLVCSFAVQAREADDSNLGFYLGGWSKHFKNENQNENNGLLAIDYRHVIVGTFDNSFHDRVYAGGYDFRWNSSYIDYGVVTGAIYGYCGNNQKQHYSVHYGCSTGGFVPLVMPYLSYSQFPAQPTIGLMWDAVIFTVKIEF